MHFVQYTKNGRKKIELLQKRLKTGQSAPTPDKQECHHNRSHKISDDVIASQIKNCITNQNKTISCRGVPLFAK